MSKIKLLVEIEEETYQEIKSRHFPLNITNACVYAVTHGTPYNPSGDLISREAVRSKIWKERVEKDEGCNSEYMRGLKTAMGFIDSAPTVDMNTELSVAYLKGRRQGQSDERPQGEWIHYLGCGIGKAVCSECGQIGETKKYCRSCGADMKGGAEK